jgi:hypothetical protein
MGVAGTTAATAPAPVCEFEHAGQLARALPALLREQRCRSLQVRRRAGRANVTQLRVLDLTVPAVQTALQIDDNGLVDDDHTRCRDIADVARAAGLDGVLAPSAGLAGERTLACLHHSIGSRCRGRTIRARPSPAPGSCESPWSGTTGSGQRQRVPRLRRAVDCDALSGVAPSVPAALRGRLPTDQTDRPRAFGRRRRPRTLSVSACCRRCGGQGNECLTETSAI